MKSAIHGLFVALLLSAVSCDRDDTVTTEESNIRGPLHDLPFEPIVRCFPNTRKPVLLIVADDMGVDATSVYGAHPDAANTPNLQLLADTGVLFRNAWANPVCSPTRAGIHTGQHAWRTGIGNALSANAVGLDYATFETLPSVVRAAGYRTGLFGKWHLGEATDGETAAQRGWLEPLCRDPQRIARQ